MSRVQNPWLILDESLPDIVQKWQNKNTDGQSRSNSVWRLVRKTFLFFLPVVGSLVMISDGTDEECQRLF